MGPPETGLGGVGTNKVNVIDPSAIAKAVNPPAYQYKKEDKDELKK